MRIDHVPNGPKGAPCNRCGNPFLSHRVYHTSMGDPCSHCGLPASNHRYRKDVRPNHEPKGDPCIICGERAGKHRKKVSLFDEQDYKNTLFLGIDGEGEGRREHRYNLLAASSEDGLNSWYIENPKGLHTVECLEFLLSLPDKTRSFAYSFQYDLTKILEDVDDETLYYLWRPELRGRKETETLKGPKPLKWHGYSLNLQGTKFTVVRDGQRFVLWDIWKFFQGKFVNAIKDWKVGNPELWERMSRMKDMRSEFDKVSPEEKRSYCLEECRCMAELARKLVEAHDAAGLKLKSFFGAGSSASAMLSNMGIQDKIVRAPEPLTEPLACAFFGGRFENSVIGRIQKEIYGRDISSAYPYQLYFLPCLMHGVWEHTKSEKRLTETSVRTAVIRYSLPMPKLKLNPNFQYWGPLPFRSKDGSVTFPAASDGGWIWASEYHQAKKLFPHIRFHEAYIYHCDCDCRPFELIPQYYCERCRIGKEGPGIVLKLGCNSCYGKLAQSLGKAQFNNWVWAGMITAGCRAQILQILEYLDDWSDLLMVATDGIMTLKDFESPEPLDTGTWHAKTYDDKAKEWVAKPLGGWEKKVIPEEKGVFFARPGIYFPMNPSEKEMKEIRARGVGKSTLLQSWENIVNSYETNGIKQNIIVKNVTRFCGAKSSISYSPSNERYTRANNVEDDKPRYGQWVSRKVEMSFDPLPKREGLMPDGIHLKLRDMRGQSSIPYKKTMDMAEETREMQAAVQELMEQPDLDLTEYE